MILNIGDTLVLGGLTEQEDTDVKDGDYDGTTWSGDDLETARKKATHYWRIRSKRDYFDSGA